LSFSSARRKELKEASTPSKASPYMGRMQPLRLSLNHLGILDPSKGRDGFYADYAKRWSVFSPFSDRRPSPVEPLGKGRHKWGCQKIMANPEGAKACKKKDLSL
jgi:hypothetical protein